MKICDLTPIILRESFTDISVEKLGIDSVVKQADANLSDEAADAIDRFVGVAHNAREQQDVWGGIMQSRQLEDAYSAKPSEQGKKIRDQLTQAFAPVKTALQSRFGNVITLYRGQEEIDKEQTERSTLSWTSDPRIAALFARIAPWEMKLKPVTDEQIRAALNTYAKTGEVKFLRLRYVRTDIPTEGTTDFGANWPINITGNAGPVGHVAAYAGNVAPLGYFECNGAAVSRLTYVKLFAVCGVFYGAGDGSTTFNLPDLRGYFLRGWSDTSGIDTGRVIGSTQADLVGPIIDPGHTHVDSGHSHTYNKATGTQPQSGSSTNCYTSNASDTTGISSAVISTTFTGISGGTETRPINVAMMYIIKS